MKFLISVGLLGSALAMAQRPFTWDAFSLPLPNEKTIRIDLVGPDCHSITGVRVDSAAHPAISITDVIYEPATSGRPFNVLHHISKPSDDRISLSGDTLRVVCSAERGASERIFISAAQPIKVAVRQNDVLLASVAVEQGVQIRDGVAESTTPEGMHQLILEGTSPLLSSASLSGRTISLADARTHLQIYENPRSSSAAGTSGLIQLTIDATGHVSSAVAKTLDEGALETIRSWAFQPFVTAGQPSAARVYVPFRVMEDGSVACGVDPKARVH